MLYSETLRVKIDPELKAKLFAEARRRRLKPSELVRHILAVQVAEDQAARQRPAGREG